MGLIETTARSEAGLENPEIAVRVSESTFEQLSKLMEQTGLGASELVGSALETYGRELDAIEAEPPYTAEQIAMIEDGLRAMREGRVKPSSEVFARLDAKYGG